jgi:hypothetical protein
VAFKKGIKIMVKILAVFILLGVSGNYVHGASAAESEADPWKSLRFLMGTWEAKTQGGSANATGSGTYTFKPELRNHILARHSRSEVCKGPADYDCEHGDLFYVYQEASGQPYRAIYFDNEGHVIHYEVSVPTASSVIFLSDPSRPGPQFRLSYELNGSTMSGKFQMRMTGQAEFKSYLEWSGAKK